MFSFPRRARFTTRLVVGLVALGVPVLGASVAQASIGTGNQVTTNLPDLRTATILPTFNEVEACFDQAIDLSGGAVNANFRVGGYPANLEVAANQPGSSPTISSERCIKSQWSFTGASTTDLQAATYFHILPNVVKNLVGANTNIADSVPLAGSRVQNGTRGHQAGPDLIIAAANIGPNQIGYRFDQRIIPSATGAGAIDGANVCDNAIGSAAPAFAYYDNQGFIHNDGTFQGCTNSTNADQTGNGNVLISFPPATSPVEQSRRAFVVDTNVGGPERGVVSTPPAVVGNRTLSVVVVGGGGGTSNDPDLTATELTDPTGATNQVDFDFDEAIAGGSIAPARFHAVAANGFVLNGTSSALLTGPNGPGTRARISFGGGGELVSEFLVEAYIDCSATQTNPNQNPANPARECDDAPGAQVPPAVSANDGQAVPPNGLPMGDNANALATGWSTGPDPISGSKNAPDQTVTIRYDQRAVNIGGNGQLVDATGLTGIFCPANAVGLLASPGQQNVTYQCPSGSDIANATGLYTPPGATASTLFLVGGGATSFNVDQIIGIG